MLPLSAAPWHPSHGMSSPHQPFTPHRVSPLPVLPAIAKAFTCSLKSCCPVFYIISSYSWFSFYCSVDLYGPLLLLFLLGVVLHLLPLLLLLLGLVFLLLFFLFLMNAVLALFLVFSPKSSLSIFFSSSAVSFFSPPPLPPRPFPFLSVHFLVLLFLLVFIVLSSLL